MALEITWYDNTAFRVATDEHVIWFDPSVNKNPGSPIRTEDIREKADFVFTTHGDPGHFTNSVEITRRTGARFVGPEDLCNFILDNKQLSPDLVVPLKFEVTQYIDGLEVYLFKAVHPELTPRLIEHVREWGGGVKTRNGGFVVRGKGYCFCLVGDCIHSEVFKKAGLKFEIDIGMIPVQGRMHQDSSHEEAAEHGARIVRDLNLKVLFPAIQYTFEMGRIDPLKRRLKEMGIYPRIIMEKPGTVHRLEAFG
ncbi:MAG: MBL fold metallo-hydrolase [Deltaproteobacteria bacterium]|nr:MBL fold metallo-hydrolase [Deltaproteobacteria bacterium]